jgi:hypothetical protein
MGMYDQPLPPALMAPGYGPLGSGLPGLHPDVWRQLAELLRGPTAALASPPPGRGGPPSAPGGGGPRAMASPADNLLGQVGRLINTPGFKALVGGANGVGDTIPGTGLFGTNLGGIGYADGLAGGLIPL